MIVNPCFGSGAVQEELVTQFAQLSKLFGRIGAYLNGPERTWMLLSEIYGLGLKRTAIEGLMLYEEDAHTELLPMLTGHRDPSSLDDESITEMLRSSTQVSSDDLLGVPMYAKRDQVGGDDEQSKKHPCGHFSGESHTTGCGH